MKTAMHTLSMGVRDCICYKKCAKTLLCISSKSVTTRFATLNPAKCHGAFIWCWSMSRISKRWAIVRIHYHSLNHEIISYWICWRNRLPKAN